MPPSSNSFYVVVPSNTNVEGNKTNSFRVRLPRKLQFGSEWDVGLAVIVYPHSWPSLGTIHEQSIRVFWKTGESVNIPIPPSNVTNPVELRNNLYKLLGEGSDELAAKTRTAQLAYHQIVNTAFESSMGEFIEGRRLKGQEGLPERGVQEDYESFHKRLRLYYDNLAQEDKKEFDEIYARVIKQFLPRMNKDDYAIYENTRPLGFEAWIHAYRKARFSFRFEFEPERNRFYLKLDSRYIQKVVLTEQLAYILGFNSTELSEPENVAKFMPDMSGGVSSFHVYAPDLIEPMMIGDVIAPVLRMVTIRGAQDEMIEEQFLSIQYHRVLLKEISEIFIEIRTSSGSLMPFQYGTCTLTLHFRKASYF